MSNNCPIHWLDHLETDLLLSCTNIMCSEVCNTSQVTRNSFDVVAKDAIRSVLGLLRRKVACNVLFAHIKLLPPSVVVDAPKQRYHRHVWSLQPERWSKLSRVCHFYGHGLVGHHTAGVNWLGQVRKFCGDLSHALNIYLTSLWRPIRRRISGELHSVPEAWQEWALIGCKLSRKMLCHWCCAATTPQPLLINMWMWMLRLGQSKHEEHLGKMCPLQ